MSRIEELIQQLCPEGVKWNKIDEIAEVYTGGEPPINSIKGSIPTENCKYPIYGNGIEIYGFADTYKINKDAVTISSIGANTGTIYYRKAYFTPIIRLKVLLPKAENILSKYLFYYLSSINISSKKSSVPNMNAGDVKKIQIPFPPLPIQQEIVTILDKFTQLEAELEVELEARKKQYEYYRNELLSFDGKDVEWKMLGDCIEKNMGGGTPSKAVANYWNGNIPWASVGDLSTQGNLIISTRNFITIEGLKNSSSNLVPKGSVIVAVKISPGKMKIANIDIAINQDLRGLLLKSFLNNRFLTYYFMTISIVGNGTIVQGITVDTLNRVKIPIPTLAEQERIVGILDKFDALVNDISVGLPAEIAARRKQYEYYRGKLLDFKLLTH
jgi:type I restriction enzyme S subunit